ncbi:hypothetical protein HDZ31DRAFT_40785 [Schizophyllum fasciatum]
MSSDDEYGFFDLNSDDFAVIDETAAKFYSQHPDATQRATPAAAPAPKPGPSKPTLGKRKTSTSDDMDILPDITIVDGGYALGPDVKRPRLPQQQSHPAASTHSEYDRARRLAQIEEGINQRSQTPVCRPAARQKTPIPPRHPPQRQPSKPTLAFRGPSAPPPSQNGNRLRGVSPMPPHKPPPPSRAKPPSSRSITPAAIGDDVQRQIKEMRDQLEALREEHERTKKSLNEEKRARWGKDGEISHLKDTLSKTTANFIAQSTKLREAKEQAEKQQAQLQRSMKDEIERIKTQFLFKQQELESRRPPMSVKPKKQPRPEPMAPVPVSSQMRGWSSAGAGPSRLQEEDVFGGCPFPSQAPSQASRRSPTKARSPEKPRPGALGFQNSFVASTPVERRKGKQKENAAQQQEQQQQHGRQQGWGAGSPQVQPPPQGEPSQQPGFDWTVQSPPAIPSPPQSPTRMQIDAPPAALAPARAPDTDVEMEDGEEIVAEEFDEIEPLDWMGELTYTILTHRMPSVTRPTLETIMRADVSDEISLRLCTECNQVLEIIGTHTKPADYASSGKAIAARLISLLQALLEAPIAPLLSLLYLMSTLIYSLPDFSSFLLSPSTDATESLLLNTLRILLTQTRKAHSEEDGNLLEHEACELLSALAWNAPSDFMPRHRILTLEEEVMAMLINAAEPSARLVHKMRYLVRLSTHRSLASSLLSLEPEALVDEDGAPRIAKPVHVDRLCKILTAADRWDEKGLELRSLILTFFSMLSVGHPDALSALHTSLPFIPSLVYFVMQLTNALWGDDEELMAAPAKATEYIRLANQTVYLLRHVVKGRESDLNLRHKLNHTPHQIFNGIMHVFVVAFGRLSYADAPDWVDKEGRDELQLLQGYAEELLNMVIDGPEGEAVWGTYQMDAENSSEAEEEDEMEAEMLG